MEYFLAKMVNASEFRKPLKPSLFYIQNLILNKRWQRSLIERVFTSAIHFPPVKHIPTRFVIHPTYIPEMFMTK